MTVGIGDGCTSHYGYGAYVLCTVADGSLSNDNFSLASGNYTISALMSVTVAPHQFYFSVGGQVPEKNDLVLQFDNRELKFSDTSNYNTILNIYIWNSITLGWSSGSDDTVADGQMVSVKLCVNE